MSFRFTPRNRGAGHYQLAAGCLLAALSCAVPLFAGPTYTVFKVPGAVSTWAASINLLGTVTGNYRDANGRPHGFVRDHSGKITTFDAPGSTWTSPRAINNAGTIAGSWVDANGIWHSFMRDSKGTITAFDPPGSTNGSLVHGINAEGAIVGICLPTYISYVRKTDGTFDVFDVNGSGYTEVFGINVAYLVIGRYIDQHSRGFVGWPNTHFTTFDPPGSTGTVPTSINGFGAITGWYTDAASVVHGFVRNPLGKIVSFDAVGSKGTFAGAINDAGAIAGYYSDSYGFPHGFVRDPQGAITSIDLPGSNETYVSSINDMGVITGNFSTDGGNTRAGFVRTP